MKSLLENRNKTAQIAFFSFIFILTGVVIFTLPRLTVPLTIAYILNLIFAPAVPAVMKFGISRNISIFIIFSLMLFLTIFPIVKAVPTLTDEAKNLQYYIPKVETFVRSEYTRLTVILNEKTGIEIGDEYIQKGIRVVRDTSTAVILNTPKTLASVVEWLFLVPLFIFFILKDGIKFRSLVLRLAPNSIFERFYYLSHQFNKQLGDYIFAKFIEATIVGVIITVGLIAMDIRFAFMLGLLAAVTNIIPYLGPVLGVVPAIIIGLAEYGVGPTFGGLMLLYLIANAIDIVFVFPILISKIVNLHPIVVVVSVILGSQLLGVLGMVISIPLATALKLIFLEIYNEIYPNRLR